MSEIRINQRDLERALKSRTVTDALERLGRDIYNDSQAVVPVDTGRLKNSGFVESEPGRVRVGYDTDYARYVHDGTTYISPRNYLIGPAARVRGRIQ